MGSGEWRVGSGGLRVISGQWPTSCPLYLTKMLVTGDLAGKKGLERPQNREINFLALRYYSKFVTMVSEELIADSFWLMADGFWLTANSQ